MLLWKMTEAMEEQVIVQENPYINAPTEGGYKYDDNDGTLKLPGSSYNYGKEWAILDKIRFYEATPPYKVGRSVAEHPTKPKEVMGGGPAEAQQLTWTNHCVMETTAMCPHPKDGASNPFHFGVKVFPEILDITTWKIGKPTELQTISIWNSCAMGPNAIHGQD